MTLSLANGGLPGFFSIVWESITLVCFSHQSSFITLTCQQKNNKATLHIMVKKHNDVQQTYNFTTLAADFNISGRRYL